MKIATFCSLTLLASVASAAEPVTGGTEPEALPRTVRVEFVNAMIGPCKSDGSHWDGPTKCGEQVRTQVQEIAAKKLAGLVSTAASFNPYSAATTLLSSMGGSFLSKEFKPDPWAIAEVAIADEWQPALKFELIPEKRFKKDTYTPEFDPHEFVVPLDRGTRFRVTLSDKDLTKSDPIGKAEVNYDDLVAALRAGKIHQVMVSDQTQNQILFLGITVRAVKAQPLQAQEAK